MNKKTALLLIVITAAILGIYITSTATADKNTKEISALAASYIQENHAAGIKQAISTLSSGIQKYPDSYNLYLQRSNYYASIGDYDKSLSDLKKASAIKKLDTSHLMLKCMLLRRIKSHDSRRCFGKVIQLMKAKPDYKLNANYVVAATFYDEKAGQAAKAYFIKHTSKNSHNYLFIKHFSPTGYLHTIFP